MQTHPLCCGLSAAPMLPPPCYRQHVTATKLTKPLFFFPVLLVRFANEKLLVSERVHMGFKSAFLTYLF